MSWRTLLLVFTLFLVVPSSASYICRSRRTDGRCLLMVNMLRDPHHMSSWNPKSFHKAINQLQAYQQLFQEDDDIMRRKRSVTTEDLLQ